VPPVHHGSDVCRYVGGLGTHGARESRFGLPELPVVRSRPREDSQSARCRRCGAAADGQFLTFDPAVGRTLQRPFRAPTSVMRD
jgi:hypothetical protein